MTFAQIFILFLVASLILELWLAKRQHQSIQAHRGEVPEDFREKISLAQHQKAADYSIAGLKLSSWELPYGALLLLLWTFGGGLELLDNFWRQWQWSEITTGVAFMVSVFLIMSLLALPFAIYRTFNLEQRFGFNNMTPALFISDLLKGALLTVIFGGLLSWVVLWLMGNAGPYWWAWVWGVLMAFTVFMIWAYPTLITPLFNKFEPLKDEELKSRIQSLLERCGFQSKGIFIMDASRRSSHGNAYFTGMGRNKRIVFFDTLTEHLSADEIEAVLAHELGHFKRKHITKRLLTMAVINFIGLALLGWAYGHDSWFIQLGISQPTTYSKLILFVMVLPAFTSFLTPLMNISSRKHEFEADEYAAQQADSSELINALVKLYKENAKTLTPDPVYSAYYDSHPPAPVRIQHLQTLESN
jgi:STE24 endopeptidase